MSRKKANDRFFFNPHPLLKTTIPKWENFPTFWRPIFWSGACFSPSPSQLFFNNGRVYRNIKNEINMEYALLYWTVKKETISIKTYLPLGKLWITSFYFYVFHFKKEHQTGLQTDEQHQIETKNTGTATAGTSAENYRTRRPRNRRESVCWTWLGHRFFYIDI